MAARTTAHGRTTRDAVSLVARAAGGAGSVVLRSPVPSLFGREDNSGCGLIREPGDPAAALPPERLCHRKLGRDAWLGHSIHSPVRVRPPYSFHMVRPQIAAREQEHKRRLSVGGWLVAALIVAGTLSVGGIVIGTLLTDRDDDLWSEVARAGVQVVAVGLIGTAVAAAWRYFELDRDRQRQVHEQQLAVFRQVVESYNEVKAIRRTLRSLGLRSFTGALNELQVSGFREQMLRLNVVQLSFEALKRELGETDIFKDDSPALVMGLYEIEHYLNGVLHIWENGRSQIDVGSDGEVVSSGLNDLIGPSGCFKAGIGAHREEITALIHKHLFGPPSQSTKDKLSELAAVDDGEEQEADTPGSK